MPPVSLTLYTAFYRIKEQRRCIVEGQRPNWVKERAECEIRSVFERIEQEVQFDVAALEEHKDRIGYGHCSFTMEAQTTIFTVTCESGGVGMGFSVQFNMHQSGSSLTVLVMKPGVQVEEHRIEWTWNEELDKCVLLYDRDPVDAWEISRRIFEPLLFEQ